MENKEFSEAPSLRSAEPQGQASCWCWPRGHVVRISSVLGLVLTAFFGKQLLTICHSFVGELSRWKAGISCCGCRSLSVFQQVGVCAFLSSPSRLSSFKHFPVCRAKYACHVGTRPWDTHQLLFVFLSPLTMFPLVPVFLKPPGRPRGPLSALPSVLRELRNCPLTLEPQLLCVFTSSRPALRSPPGHLGHSFSFCFRS